MNKWLSLPELMQRLGTSTPENIFELIRAGLPVYERRAPLKPSKPVWAGGSKESQIVQLTTDEERQKPQRGQIYPHSVLFLATDVEAFEQARDGARQSGIAYDIPQNELARMCDVTARTIANWMKCGLLFESQGREKRFSLPLVIRWLEQTGKLKELESLNNSK